MLISGEYQQVLESTHADNAGWGKGGLKYLEDLTVVMMGKSHKVLDYGAGKGQLGLHLLKAGHDVHCYDPGVPKWRRPPPYDQYDAVICTDVLEHIEPECLDAVLEDIKGLMGPESFAFFAVGTKPAVKTLSDGRNAHLIVENGRWWLDKLAEHFISVSWTDERPAISEFWAYGSVEAALGVPQGTFEEVAKAVRGDA